MRLPIRVGLGFDFHPFVADRPLYLGGVRVPWDAGLEGHSDADVLLHAVTDAVLGAAGLSDIGSYFPDSDPKYRGVSSLLLLKKAHRLVRGKGYRVANVDIAVLAEAPRIKPYADAIKANIARVLEIAAGDVGVKATTMEGKGVVGRGEGIGVFAVALVVLEE